MRRAIGFQNFFVKDYLGGYFCNLATENQTARAICRRSA